MFLSSIINIAIVIFSIVVSDLLHFLIVIIHIFYWGGGIRRPPNGERDSGFDSFLALHTSPQFSSDQKLSEAALRFHRWQWADQEERVKSQRTRKDCVVCPYLSRSFLTHSPVFYRGLLLRKWRGGGVFCCWFIARKLNHVLVMVMLIFPHWRSSHLLFPFAVNYLFLCFSGYSKIIWALCYVELFSSSKVYMEFAYRTTLFL